MEKSASSSSSSSSAGIGSRFSDLNKSFKLALRSLLTSCSNQEFHEAFSSFTNPEKELLHRLFLQVITSLHENIEEEFESICLRTQVGATLDAVEEIVEERDLDPLSSDRNNIMDVAENLSKTKKNEIQHLMHMVQLVRMNSFSFNYAENKHFLINCIRYFMMELGIRGVANACDGATVMGGKRAMERMTL